MNYRKNNDMEYNKGGGGSSGSFVRRIYSKQCYSDPNNPGKMICKEINEDWGYDPTTQSDVYKNRRENTYESDKGFFGKMYMFI